MEERKSDIKNNLTIKVIGMTIAMLGLVFGIIAFSFTMVNSYVSKYLLAMTLYILLANRVYAHIINIDMRKVTDYINTGIIFISSIMVCFAKFSIYYLSVPIILFCVSIIIDRVYYLVKDHKPADIILNVLVILFALFYMFVFMFPAIFEKQTITFNVENFVVVTYSLFVIVSLTKIFMSYINVKPRISTFVNVLRKTYAFQILMGLTVLMIICSIFFTVIEPDMDSFIDSLWYCFALVTTIGFGDVTVTTIFGRILSVILGMYGIVVIALLTSIIVNVYNDIGRKKELSDLKKEELALLEKEKEEEMKEEHKEK